MIGVIGIRNGLYDAGVVDKIVGGCFDDPVAEIFSVCGGGVPVISGVVDHDVADVCGIAAHAVVFSVCGFGDQFIRHFIISYSLGLV